MAHESLITLSSGPLRLALAPERGGCVTRFDHVAVSGSKTEIFRGVEGAPDFILDAASFALVPFCNRVRGGTFDFRNRKVTLAGNLPGEPSPLHGQGWVSTWEVVRCSKDAAELLFHHAADEWPWDYEARQFFTLRPTGLEVVLSCSNLSDQPMPCGLGHHPYFRCDGDTRLDAKVACAWTIDEQVLPVENVPAEGRYDLRRRAVCGQDLDNGFGGWDGRARIDGALRIELSSPEAKFFHLYSPPVGGFFAAEPASHANAALNEPQHEWAELGLRVLDPGETMTLTMRVDVAQ